MADIPVHFAGPETFARVRGFFENAGYDAAFFNRLVGELKRSASIPPRGAMVDPALPLAEILLRLFLGGRITETDFRRVAGDQHLEDLLELGLVRLEDGVLRTPVRLRPLFDFYVISDQQMYDDHFPDDFVHAPDDMNSISYLSYVPLSPCEDFLEACGGSGVAALIAARHYAGKAWSSDIAERSSTFARFNAALNGVENFTAVTGDAYEPLGDRTFDRIAVHPPYVPVLRHSYLFHGGGQDGEQITKRHVIDAPKHLKPGGRLYCRCMATDRTGEPFEARIRQWLGERHSEFDVVLQVLGYVDPWRFLTKSVRTGRTKPEDLAEWETVFKTLGIEKMLMSVFVIQRHDSAREPFTLRREEGPYSGPRELEWLLTCETARAKQGPQIILDARLTASRSATLNIVHTPQDGDWQMRRQYVEVIHPYPLKYEIDPFSAYVLPRMNGTRTGKELFDSLINEGVIRPDDVPTAMTNFANGLANLVTGGYVIAEGFEPPNTRPRASFQQDEED